MAKVTFLLVLLISLGASLSYRPRKCCFCLSSYFSAVYIQRYPTDGITYSRYHKLFCPESPLLLGTNKGVANSSVLHILLVEILDYASIVRNTTCIPS